LVRQVTAPAMPRAGRWLTRACRPGGSGSNHSGWGRRFGHGDHPGSRSGRAARPAPRSGGTSMRRPEPLYPLPPAGSSRPAGDVTSREISPAIYGERCNAVAGADWGARQTAINGLAVMLEERGGTSEVLRKRALGFGRGDQGTMAASGVAPRGCSLSASAPPGRSDHTTGQARWLAPCRQIKAHAEMGRALDVPQAVVRCGRQRSTAVNRWGR
jgi:hypothetical protein